MASVVPAAAVLDNPPDSADPRATAHAGNAVTCKDAGLAGEIVQVDAQIDESNSFIQITDVPSDVELTGIVVKGGPAYNVYGPGERLALHAPLNHGGNIAQISHWFVCGQQVSPTDAVASEKEATAPEKEESAPDEADGVASNDTEAEASTNSPDGGNSSDGDTELANTGFTGSGLLLAVGGGLLVIGGGLVLGVWTVRRRDNTTTG